MFANKQLMEKWSPILDHDSVDQISDPHRRAVTAQLLENQESAQRQTNEALVEASDPPTSVNAHVSKYDPILISLVRRSMPNLIAYDICGVQPMTGPTGLIFALRPKYVAPDAQEIQQLTDDAFYNEANSAWSGTGDHLGTDPTVDTTDPLVWGTGEGITTEKAEILGSNHPDADPWNEMGFEIEKVTVTAKSRALKAQYSVELAQDMKNVHGLDAETELANILSAEIMAELNREVIRTVYATSKIGAQNADLTAPGEFDLDLDSNGRWSVEKFKGLMFQLEREANALAKETRRGKGNIVLCSADVASALAMAGVLDSTPALNTPNPGSVDDTGNTFVGTLNGRFRIYIDPYHAGNNFIVMGYKGASAFDAGLFYAPYVPLTLYKTMAEDTFQPRMGFKTRYGMVANPFADGAHSGRTPESASSSGNLNINSNLYYRKFIVKNLAGAAS